MQSHRFLALVRASAWYDLLVTWPFAMPWTFAWLYAQLAAVSSRLGLPGVMPTLDPLHVLFANLLGSVVVVWSLARILAPAVALGRLDALARLLFATWQVHAWLAGADAIILFFTVFEVSFGLLQLLPLAGARRSPWPRRCS